MVLVIYLVELGGKAATEEIERICACSFSIWHLEILQSAQKCNDSMHIFHLTDHTVDIHFKML